MKARLRKMRPRFFLSGFFLSWQSMQLFHEKNGVTIPNMPPVRAAARGRNTRDLFSLTSFSLTP
jgi:hypothetical protein